MEWKKIVEYEDGEDYDRTKTAGKCGIFQKYS